MSIILLTLVIASVFLVDQAEANVIDDLENKREEIKDERAEIKEDLSEAEAEIADLLLDLKDLNTEIQQLENALTQNQEALDETEEEIQNLEEEIQELEEEIEVLEENIEKRNDLLKERIKSYQKNGGNVGFIQVLFGAKSFTEFISRVSAVTKITSSDQELIEKQEEDKAQIEEVQDTVQKMLDEQKDMKTELVGIEEVIIEQKDQAEDSQAELQEKEEKLKKKKSELESRDSRLSALEAEVRRDIASAQNPAPTPRSSNSSSNQSSAGDLTTVSDKQSTSTSSSSSSGSGGLKTVTEVGKQFIGNTSYIWGSASPANGGFDCSGFVNWAFNQAGYSLPRDTSGQSTTGQKVSPDNMQPGDLVFFNTYKTDGHVGIYLGNGQFIGSQSSSGVAIESMSNSYWKSTFTGHVRRVQ